MCNYTLYFINYKLKNLVNRRKTIYACSVSPAASACP